MMIKMIVKSDGEINQLDNHEKRWFAIYTKYKCEKYVVMLLDRKRISSYVPLQTKIKRYKSKVKKSQIPLINNYVFVHITKKEYISVLETEYVFRFIKLGKNLISIPEEELDVLRRIVGDIEDMLPLLGNTISVGEEVEVIGGQLIGLTGKVISQMGKKKFVIELKNIGYQFHIQIDLALLKPLRLAKALA